MGFDIAVVAIDLVWAVGLLQIQNRLDSAKANKNISVIKLVILFKTKY